MRADRVVKVPLLRPPSMAASTNHGVASSNSPLLLEPAMLILFRSTAVGRWFARYNRRVAGSQRQVAEGVKHLDEIRSRLDGGRPTRPHARRGARGAEGGWR